MLCGVWELGGALSEQIVARAPFERSGGSGNMLERVTLRDGRELICKRVSPEWDWISRSVNDHGRVVSMWANGLFERMPAGIDHATVGVEGDSSGWTVFMDDLSGVLLPDARRLDRSAVRRVLAAMAELHHVFWGETFDDLCSLEDRYQLLSPRTAEREIARGERAGHLIARCWDEFSELVADDIASTILTMANRPGLLAEELAKCEQTLIHGDLRLNNLGFRDDRVVLIDWGDRTGGAPPAVELASFLIFDAKRFDVSRDDVVNDFRDLYRERFDGRALQLALIGGMVQLGCHIMLPIVLRGDEEARESAASELAWWIPTVARALETWSPA
jgi:phosphotransferase family enzyme